MIYTHAELTARFMAGWKPAKKYGEPLRAKVMRAFGVGSTVAREICDAHGMDPDAPVKQRRL